MYPERKETVGPHTVEEFYWNGKLITYIDNHYTDDSFDQAVERLRRMEADKPKELGDD